MKGIFKNALSLTLLLSVASTIVASEVVETKSESRLTSAKNAIVSGVASGWNRLPSKAACKDAFANAGSKVVSFGKSTGSKVVTAAVNHPYIVGGVAAAALTGVAVYRKYRKPAVVFGPMTKEEHVQALAEAEKSAAAAVHPASMAPAKSGIVARGRARAGEMYSSTVASVRSLSPMKFFSKAQASAQPAVAVAPEVQVSAPAETVVAPQPAVVVASRVPASAQPAVALASLNQAPVVTSATKPTGRKLHVGPTNFGGQQRQGKQVVA